MEEENVQLSQELDMNVSVEDKNVVLIDEYYLQQINLLESYNKMDGLMSFGDQNRLNYYVPIDRRFKRHRNIQPNYVGKTVDSILSEKSNCEMGFQEKRR